MEGYQDLIIQILKEQPYQSLGSELRFTCPFCHSEKHKFYINQDNGLYICYNCNRKGSLTSLLHDLLSIPYLDAESMLKDQAIEMVPDNKDNLYDNLLDIQLEDYGEDISPSELAHPPLPSNTKPLTKNINNPEAYPYFAYLNTRGVTWKQIKDNDISYVDTGKCLTKTGKELYVNHSILFKTFWKGNLVYWNTRSIDKYPWIKTFNASAHEGEYSRNDVVFGLNQVKQGQSLVICEGVFNALTVTNEHYQGVATFGKQVTDSQLQLMVSQARKYEDIRLFLDNDAKVIENDLADRLSYLYNPNKILLVNNPYGQQDANDLGSQVAQELVSKAQPINLLSKINDLI